MHFNNNLFGAIILPLQIICTKCTIVQRIIGPLTMLTEITLSIQPRFYTYPTLLKRNTSDLSASKGQELLVE